MTAMLVHSGLAFFGLVGFCMNVTGPKPLDRIAAALGLLMGLVETMLVARCLP